jgi:hypothetical protein
MRPDEGLLLVIAILSASSGLRSFSSAQAHQHVGQSKYLLEPPEGEHPNIIGTAMSAAMTATQIRRLLLFEELVILFSFPPC